MSRTRFNKLHKYTICINNHDYRIVHVPFPEGACYCSVCDACKYKQDCIEKQVDLCDSVIGSGHVLKLIKDALKHLLFL